MKFANLYFDFPICYLLYIFPIYPYSCYKFSMKSEFLAGENVKKLTFFVNYFR